MRDGITRLTYQQMENEWSRKVKQEYEGLASAEDIIGFLQDPRFRVTFRYALCRFLREMYGKKEKGHQEVSIVTYAGFRGVFSDGPDTPLAAEVEAYILLMMTLAKERGMEGELQSKLLRRYLTGKQENVSRDTLFKMAFAFDMDCEYVCELLEALDEVPYNLRRPEECIYYFCQYSEGFNRWETAQELIRWYYKKGPAVQGQDSTGVAEGGIAEVQLYAGQSRLMEEQISTILYGLEDPEEQKKAFLAYLDSHRGELKGYQRSAYQEADALLDALKEILGAEDDTELSIRLWEPIWVQYHTKKADKTGVNRSDFVPWKDLLDLPKTVYEKPLWRARIQKLRERKVPVEKRDILFLNCMRWTLDRKSEGGADAMQEFIMETNDILLESGLSVIYPPNAYDRMILLAVCSDSPYDVLSDIFQAATDEEKLREQIGKKKR
ncbi:MAG: hypothetical protein HFG22_04035 [Lachnospiraceae bacterium]|nr:hypothetical protein [Lachnospiraceae bacterium]